MKKPLLIILCLCCQFVSGQSNLFKKIYPSLQGYASTIAETTDGNLFASIHNSGGLSIAKFSTTGVPIWAKTISSNFLPYDAVALRDTSVILSGRWQTVFQNFWNGPTATSDLGFIKIDKNGNVAFKAGWGFTEYANGRQVLHPEFIRDADIASNGDIIACGAGSREFYYSQISLVRIDASTGDTIWTALFSPVGWPKLRHGASEVVESQNGDLTMVGEVGSRGFLVVMTDSLGVPKFSKSYTFSSGSLRNPSINKLSNGTWRVIAYHNTSNLTGMAVIDIDSSGDTLNSTFFPGVPLSSGGGQLPQRWHATPDSGLFSFFSIYQVGNYALGIIKVALDGTIQFSKFEQLPNSIERIFSSAMTSSGSIIGCGYQRFLGPTATTSVLLYSVGANGETSCTLQDTTFPSFPLPLTIDTVPLNRFSSFYKYDSVFFVIPLILSDSDLCEPVILADMSLTLVGKKENAKMLLSWLAPIGTSVVLERGTDGRTFFSIWTGFGDKARDEAPAIGTNYYRLRANDPDGDAIYSNVIEEVFDYQSGIMSIPYPNPARTILNIPNVESAQLFDVSGKLIKTGTFTKQLDISNCSPGVYFLHLRDGVKRRTHKIAIQ